MVVAAALAVEEVPAPLLLPLEADVFRRRYEDCFTRPAATPVAFAFSGLASAAGGDAVSRGSLEAHGGEAVAAERGDLAAADRGEPAFLLPDRDGDEEPPAPAAAFRASREDTLCGDEGPLGAGAGDAEGDTAALTDDTGAEDDATSGTARDAAAGTAAAAAGAGARAGEGLTPDDPAGLVFSASAAARKATRDGDAFAPAAAALGERVGEAAVFPAAARAEAKVVAGRADGNADGLGSSRTNGEVGAAGAGAAAAGSAATATAAGTAAAAAVAAVAARVPAETATAPPDRPERASASVLLILGASARGLRLGASVDRSASPGMRPPRSVASASAFADVSSQEMSSAAPFCWRGVAWQGAREKDGGVAARRTCGGCGADGRARPSLAHTSNSNGTRVEST